MTPAPKKAAPIPAESFTDRAYEIICEAVGPRQDEWSSFDHAVMDLARDADEALAKARADREARPSLPDSREERIRAEAAEDERDRLYASLKGDGWGVSGARLWLQSQGAMLPADRARARQGGNNG